MFVLSIWGCQNAEFELLKRKEGKKEEEKDRERLANNFELTLNLAFKISLPQLR